MENNAYKPAVQNFSNNQIGQQMKNPYNAYNNPPPPYFNPQHWSFGKIFIKYHNDIKFDQLFLLNQVKFPKENIKSALFLTLFSKQI